MGALDGRIAIITGAGRGLGRAYALAFAAEGARLIVNDLGTGPDGEGDDSETVRAVADEVRELGGEVEVHHGDVTNWAYGRALVEKAVSTYGGLDVLVNNAGILRDRALVNMSETDWDIVTSVHLKGHFVPTRWAATYWRDRAKAGEPCQANIVNTSSTSGLLGNPGQTNYGSAKAGVAAFSAICAQELSRYGVRSNCIAPAARTRLTEATPGLSDMVAKPVDEKTFDIWDPANVAPLVAYLSTAECPHNGRTFFIQGNTVRTMEGWRLEDTFEHEGRWSVDDLAAALAGA